MSRVSTSVAMLGVWLCMTLAVPAAASGVAGAQWRYWSFPDGNDVRDPIVYFAPGPFHVQLEYWDSIRGVDRFRPELGLHLRDRRRSSYTLQWRHEGEAERFWLGTEQVLRGGWVGRAELSPIFGPGDTQTVVALGADRYWRSYDFAGVTVLRDPRADGLWVVPMRVRLATEQNDWCQITFAPASRRSVGWAVDARWRWLRVGVERNSRFDFTTRDNTISTLGLEVPLHSSAR